MFTITVWKNGTWKIWKEQDAAYAQEDPDFLLNIVVPSGADAKSIARTNGFDLKVNLGT